MKVVLSLLFFLASSAQVSAWAAPEKFRPKIKSIVFDMGGLLLKPEVEAWKKNMTALVGDISAPRFVSLCDRFEAGRLSVSKFRDSIRAFRPENRGLTDAQIDAAWSSQVGASDCEALQMVRSIRAQGYKTYVLSTSSPTIEKVIEASLQKCFPGEKNVMSLLFDKVYWTYNMGELKPSPKLYSLMMEDLGKAASREALVLDDSPANILGAEKAGLYSLLISGRGFINWLPRVLGAN